MKRRLSQLLLFLLLGAIFNVAVAWGIAAFVRLSGPQWKVSLAWHRFAEPVIQNGKELDWIIERSEAFGNTRLRSYGGWSDRTGGNGPEAIAICPYWSGYPDPLHDGRETGLNMNACGWPLRSLLYRWTIKGSFDEAGKPKPMTVKFVNGIGLSDFLHPSPGMNVMNVRGLPYEPIWPGFAINTFFYGGIVWLLFSGPGVVRQVRRWRRIKRGLCPVCAYPIGASDVCSECGRPTPSPAGRRLG